MSDYLKIKASDEVKKRLLLGSSQESIANLIGITRQTLSIRLKKHNWKKSEIIIILGKQNFLFKIVKKLT